MLHLPKRHDLGIIFDSIFGKLRCLGIEALSKVRRLRIRCAMGYRAIFDIQVHADDEIPIAQLKEFLSSLVPRSSVASSAVFAIHLSSRNGLRLTQLGATDVRIALENLNLLESESKLGPFPQLINRLKKPS
jgi:hypothetical protein